MTKLEYTLRHDTLFKMLFVKYPELLKRLVAVLISIKYESIEQFAVINPEISPETLGDKFCRLDINMIVNGQRTDLEVQVENEGDYPDRSLYYWARQYSTALGEGGKFRDLPRTVIINIIYFKQFECKEFHSQFEALEITRHTRLTDKFCMHYFELPKLNKKIKTDDNLMLWLAFFNAKTEEDLAKIEKMEAPVMKEAISAYRHVVATNEFKEIERLRSLARHNEASALYNAEQRGEKRGAQRGAKAEREKWQDVVADKDAALAEQAALIAELQTQINKKN